MKAWSAIVALLIAALAGHNLLRLSQRVPPPPRSREFPAPDVVMRQEERFARVKAALQKRGVPVTIGYVTDTPADPHAAQDYFLAQFALAPWVLEANYNDCHWVVVNARGPFVPPGFRIVDDSGRGVLLVQKITR